MKFARRTQRIEYVFNLVRTDFRIVQGLLLVKRIIHTVQENRTDCIEPRPK